MKAFELLYGYLILVDPTGLSRYLLYMATLVRCLHGEIFFHAQLN